MRDDSEHYRRAWDAYYASVADDPLGAPWDVSSGRAGALDRRTFDRWFSGDLPVVDLGCGTGTQAAFLRTIYDRVVGVDVSPEVVARARARHGSPGLDFEVLDVLSATATDALHDRLGDADVYMRGLLQQIQPTDRPAFGDGVRTLLGRRGTLFFVEVAPAARDHFVELQRRMGGLPAELRRVLGTRITRLVGVALHDVGDMLPGLGVEASGSTTLALRLGPDRYTAVPATWAVLRPSTP